jgi:UDP-glucose 4-epimerase
MLVLLDVMRSAKVHTLIFSSSAAVYGEPVHLPLHEQLPRSVTNPYARSKLFLEDVLADLCFAEPHWKVMRLRYFNPVGAHESGLIGECAKDIPNNLMPYVQQVAAGLQPYLSVYGNDYNTPDGTGVRDYIHVMDLAEGHVAALNYLNTYTGMFTINLGTGRGTSVLELIQTFEEVNDCRIPYQIAARRAGDVAACWADVSLAAQILQWQAKRDLAQMCRDSWHWTKKRGESNVANTS